MHGSHETRVQMLVRSQPICLRERESDWTAVWMTMMNRKWKADSLRVGQLFNCQLSPVDSTYTLHAELLRINVPAQ